MKLGQLYPNICLESLYCDSMQTETGKPLELGDTYQDTVNHQKFSPKIPLLSGLSARAFSTQIQRRESICCFSSCACWQIALPKTQWLTSKSIFRKGFWKSLDIFLETNLISKTLWDKRAYESKIEGNLKFGGQKCSSRNTVWPCWAFHHLVTCSIDVYILWFLLSQNFLFTDVPTMTLQHCLFERKQCR